MPEDHSVRRMALGRAEAGGFFDEHRNRIKAREAAEALFAPKRQASEPLPSHSAPAPAAEQSPRQPRILSIVSSRAPAAGEPVKTPRPREPSAPLPAEPVATPAREEPAPRALTPSHISRIRGWLRYGMTVRQVAELYGVAVPEIERALETL